jgi:hypothetical protein
MLGVFSEERMGLSFTVAAGPRQRRQNRFRIPSDSLLYFPFSNSIFPQPGVPGRRIYIPQEQGDPVITSGTGSQVFSERRLPFNCLLQLTNSQADGHFTPTS